MMDMHCHIDLYDNPFEIAEKCHEKKIYVLSVTTTPKAWYGTNKLAENKPRIKTALGLHPQVSHERYHELELFDALLKETKYVGEIGLDGGKEFSQHWDIQLKSFRHILKSVNASGGKIMSIHSRFSADNVINELKGINGIPILHWFTGTKTQLRKAIDIGCWFSVGPTMLNSKKGQSLIALIPKDKVLLETDGPLAKYDKRPVMPWDSNITLLQLSVLWQVPLETVKSQLFSNFENIVRLHS